MRLNLLSILGASMLATAGLSADSVNLSGSFDLQGEQAKCAQGDQPCLDLAQAKFDCWTKNSSGDSDMAICLDHAQRAWEAATGKPSDMTASNTGESPVVTEVSNSDYDLADPADHKGGVKE
ncbi:hypothetical protein Bealeia2_00721 [Candidatus Bealeia paramacronuclearis]|uniref:hypothetical protein n=1 Tax=Candidatus Bealeia paramacronuclearis TaxID=1921001 RepID=UPI002B575BD3|nr:hypothetical protein [Candidatus Bealeia paramacronuclearis]